MAGIFRDPVSLSLVQFLEQGGHCRIAVGGGAALESFQLAGTRFVRAFLLGGQIVVQLVSIPLQLFVDGGQTLLALAVEIGTAARHQVGGTPTVLCLDLLRFRLGVLHVLEDIHRAVCSPCSGAVQRHVG